MGFLIRLVVNAAALWVAAQLVPGFVLSGVTPLLLAALVLGLINAIVRPILLILTLPLTLVTLGLFLFILNAFCIWLTSRLVPGSADGSKRRASRTTRAYECGAVERKRLRRGTRH